MNDAAIARFTMGSFVCSFCLVLYVLAVVRGQGGLIAVGFFWLLCLLGGVATFSRVSRKVFAPRTLSACRVVLVVMMLVRLAVAWLVRDF